MIARLYEEDARGLHDEGLIDDVGCTLLLRCESMLAVAEARRGRAECPVCKAAVEHTKRKRSHMNCGECGWSGSWGAYRKSMDGHHLIAPGLQPFCREYVRQFTAARTSKERFYWIDWLIHRAHWQGTAHHGQPGATSFIEGRAHHVNAFLSALTQGTHRDPDTDTSTQYWTEAMLARARKWRDAADKRRRKKEEEKPQS